MTLTGKFVKMVLGFLTKYYCNLRYYFKFYLRRFDKIKPERIVMIGYAVPKKIKVGGV